MPHIKPKEMLFNGASENAPFSNSTRIGPVPSHLAQFPLPCDTHSITGDMVSIKLYVTSQSESHTPHCIPCMATGQDLETPDIGDHAIAHLMHRKIGFRCFYVAVPSH